MDNENGALTRVVTQLKAANELFKGDTWMQIQEAVREFSLDDETSTLSRLVTKVEQAKDQITNEFSLDNAGSAINKLNLVLAETKRSINDNLTLDNDQSALARLENQLTTVLNEMRGKNEEFPGRCKCEACQSNYQTSGGDAVDHSWDQLRSGLLCLPESGNPEVR